MPTDPTPHCLLSLILARESQLTPITENDEQHHNTVRLRSLPLLPNDEPTTIKDKHMSKLRRRREPSSLMRDSIAYSMHNLEMRQLTSCAGSWTFTDRRELL